LFDYIELIKRFQPRVFLIENVPGLGEIDGGEQLRVAYKELEDAGYTVNQPLIIKAAFHLVPQQRVRLFIIGSRNKKTFKQLIPTEQPMACGSVFNIPLGNIENHITREHSAESVSRYVQLAYGKRDQLGRVDRLDPSKPSKTVIAGGSKGGGRSHLHPYIPRTLSVRESARLQTFPDDYIFTGPVARQFTQVGNAVPPVLGAQLAKAIKDSFF
jgi:DNA (cytosine-5)-methyltransferase 1